MRILIISGSLRAGSFNRQLAEVSRAHLSKHHDVQHWLGLADLPFFNEDHEAEEPAAVRSIRDAVRSADALVVVTPEYNSSLPGVLKNALDWLSRPRGDAALSGKPTVVLGASPSPAGAAQARQDAIRILSRSGAATLETSFGIASAWRVFADGDLTDEAVRTELGTILDDLAAFAAQPALLTA